ncbi:hypothetical protein [Lysinibacillus sphaericus]|uniref:Uncharacterized protein n=1 Tax=Lysinibacillus sphaericus TaxID=1421 RepID=A0A6G9ZZB8_LYSSH|nr:hypothetical protein [Lysinibacillus sphaericus]QIS31122.1 hypothetical protein [Lysinibacillus sphaericus]QPA61323.1 hypothetical protein INQ55_23620 [Lysinibacillus sphaericus]
MEFENLRSKGYRVVNIDLSSNTTSYFNPFVEVRSVDEEAVEKLLEENTIPLLNSAAQLYKGFTLSRPEVTKIKEIVAEGIKKNRNFDILDLRDELIKQNNNLDFSRIIELLNLFYSH